MVSTRSMERQRLASASASASASALSNIRPENWRAEDDRPELHHIPHQYGVPVDDFNWDWYYDMIHKRQTFQKEKEKEKASQYQTSVLGILLILSLVSVIYCML